jgi:hypothetical protein
MSSDAMQHFQGVRYSEFRSSEDGLYGGLNRLQQPVMTWEESSTH